MHNNNNNNNSENDSDFNNDEGFNSQTILDYKNKNEDHLRQIQE